MSTPLQPETIEPAFVQPSQVHGSGLARSAGVLAAGNLVSRVLGLVREMVIAALFGASGEVSAFRVAAQVPTLIYDFLVGGMLSAALVPVLSDYALRNRKDFLRLVSVVVSVFSLVLALLVLVLELVAPALAMLLAGGFRTSDPSLIPLTVQLIRLLAPVVWFLSMAGVATAILFALRRFTFPALATAVFNLGIIIAAPLLVSRLGIYSLAVGLLLGSVAQLMLMTTDIWRARVRFTFLVDLHHPALRRILWLYLPIAASLLVSLFQVGLDRRLASGTGASSIAWMANATTLQQMPLGLVSIAISLAALPRLSQFFAAGNEVAFRQTLARGLRMLWLLVAPAAVGLWLLGTPVTTLLFERGQFTAYDTAQVVRALNVYLIGMIFAAVDFPLNFAFYACNNTLLPALVGILSVGVYTVLALTLVEPYGYLGLVWADTAKQATHMVIMVLLLWRVVGRLGANTVRGYVQMAFAALVMGTAIWLLVQAMNLLPLSGATGNLLLVAAGGITGILVYAAVLLKLGVPEIQPLLTAVRSRLPGR